MPKVLLLLVLIAVILEGTILSLPLVAMSLLLLTVQFKTADVFIVAFFSGLALDVLLVRQIGETSVVFLILLLFVFLYDRKYEVRSLLFVTLGTAIAIGVYLIIFPSSDRMVQILLTTLLGASIFTIIRRLDTKPKQTYNLS